MTYITKHDTEQEWEGHNSEHSWVYFLVVRDTISVDNLLEHHCDFVNSKMCGRFYSVILNLLKSWDSVRIILNFKLCHFSNDFFVIILRNPAEPNIESILLLELVQRGVETLLFLEEQSV